VATAANPNFTADAFNPGTYDNSGRGQVTAGPGPAGTVDLTSNVGQYQQAIDALQNTSGHTIGPAAPPGTFDIAGAALSPAELDALSSQFNAPPTAAPNPGLSATLNDPSVFDPGFYTQAGRDTPPAFPGGVPTPTPAPAAPPTPFNDPTAPPTTPGPPTSLPGIEPPGSPQTPATPGLPETPMPSPPVSPQLPTVTASIPGQAQFGTVDAGSDILRHYGL
jgi:hypothetical protein